MARSGWVRFGVAAGAVALALAGLTGCSGGQSPTETYAGLPEGVPDVTEVTGEPQAFYLDDGGAIAIVLWGSSACPPIAASMTVVEDASSGNRVEVALESPPSGACTDDLAPHTSAFATPADVTTTEPLTITLPDAEIVLVE
ncbi:hypothetical protein JOD63_002515 [Microbacterium terrae]|uniref:Uncharacterized protein n=1 Tax=Microbacterium terrae TaxID=69369 RepID=A0A0M2H884_9MICO|nr:hypothetical protein [Microbacterium terrae]KJL42740.1 hypothetical protein RS81_01081 [Microbacterium terrae]MBP1078547.1 hypothetical protein [Microbacterium terrae]GLJ97947.1 hypothetical protein GCM10017594_11440 [Microbacterium terrae]